MKFLTVHKLPETFISVVCNSFPDRSVEEPADSETLTSWNTTLSIRVHQMFREKSICCRGSQNKPQTLISLHVLPSTPAGLSSAESGLSLQTTRSEEDHGAQQRLVYLLIRVSPPGTTNSSLHPQHGERPVHWWGSGHRNDGLQRCWGRRGDQPNSRQTGWLVGWIVG